MRNATRLFAGPGMALLCLLGSGLACQHKEGTNTNDLGGTRLASKAPAPETPAARILDETAARPTPTSAGPEPAASTERREEGGAPLSVDKGQQVSPTPTTVAPTPTSGDDSSANQEVGGPGQEALPKEGGQWAERSTFGPVWQPQTEPAPLPTEAMPIEAAPPPAPPPHKPALQSRPNSLPRPPASPRPKVADVQGLEVTLRACYYRSGDLHCEVTVENGTAADRVFRLGSLYHTAARLEYGGVTVAASSARLSSSHLLAGHGAQGTLDFRDIPSGFARGKLVLTVDLGFTQAEVGFPIRSVWVDE
jgi:hypothetical protein